jgi:hypothetical protein
VCITCPDCAKLALPLTQGQFVPILSRPCPPKSFLDNVPGTGDRPAGNGLDSKCPVGREEL